MSTTHMPAARRKDIEGLRAIGMALVVICHIWVGKVSGGVDVFFVISAYLMTGSLLKQLEKTGTVDLLGFWGRILVRICPTAFLILFLTLMAGLYFQPISLWRAFATHGWMALLQLENLQLLRESTDYLARGQPASPFQQYWALSTQMQFYGFLPIWLLLVSQIARTTRNRGDDRRILTIACALIGLASFVFALWILALNPAPHYFNPAARLWEFMAGALCACVAPMVTLRARAASVARTVGLLLILACVWVVPANAAYPGIAALVPVSGAMLILLSGRQAVDRSLARRVLEAPLLQRLASLSFAFYLAHWPILIFYQEAAGTTRLNLIQGCLVIALALLLAALVHRLIERPTKGLMSHGGGYSRGDWRRRSAPFAAGAMLAVPSAAFLLSWQQYYGGIARDYAQSYTVRPIAGPIQTMDTVLPRDIDRQLIAAKGMLPRLYTNGCDTGPHSAKVQLCTTGNLDSNAFTILLIGGSHSTQWFPALEQIAKDRNWRLLSITKSACPIDGVYIGPRTAGRQVKACREWARHAVAKAIALKPDLVVTTATRPGPGNVGEVIPEGYVDAWRRITANNIDILAIRDNPRTETYSVPECVDRNRANFRACDMRRDRHISSPSRLLPVRDMPHLALWDIADLLCGIATCPVMHDGLLVYNDNSHLSVPFVMALRTSLEREILGQKESNSY